MILVITNYDKSEVKTYLLGGSKHSFFQKFHYPRNPPTSSDNVLTGSVRYSASGLTQVFDCQKGVNFK